MSWLPEAVIVWCGLKAAGRPLIALSPEQIFIRAANEHSG